MNYRGASNSTKLGTLGVGSFVGTFGLFDFLSREKTSTSTNGAFASTFAIQGFIFGEPTQKKGRKRWISKRC
jgi:hypothetical protein